MRGVYVVSTGPAAGLQLDGFTIRNGIARGIAARPGDDAINAFGGGMLVESSQVTLRNLTFQNNQALGNNTTSAYGGSAGGGGLALRTTSYANVLANLTFTGNVALGGSGADRGGYGIGGGLYTYYAVVSSGHDITLTGNSAAGGSTNGTGVDRIRGELADGQGGGIAIHLNSYVTLQRLTVLSNSAAGGAAPNGNAGGAFGGGIFSESASAMLADLTLNNNSARGGNGINSAAQTIGTGLAWGGGMATMNATVSLDRAYVIGNVAQGGNGQTFMGSAGGGGSMFLRTTGNSTINLYNTLIADNSALLGGGTTSTGGGGGGLWLQGVYAGVNHATIADNRISNGTMLGQGVVLLNVGTGPSNVGIEYSIIANHANNFGGAAIHVQPNNVVTFNRGLFANNTLNTNSSGAPTPSGTLGGLGTMLSASTAGFISSGAPNENYHLRLNSAAKDQALGSSMYYDLDGNARSNPDLGALEYVPFPAGASPADRRLTVSWQPNAGLIGIVNRYTLVVTCPAGASPPTQGACGSAINASTATQFVLTGLTNFKTYTIVVNALDASGQVAATSPTLAAAPSNRLVFLPILKK